MTSSPQIRPRIEINDSVILRSSVSESEGLHNKHNESVSPLNKNASFLFSFLYFKLFNPFSTENFTFSEFYTHFLKHIWVWKTRQKIFHVHLSNLRKSFETFGKSKNRTVFDIYRCIKNLISLIKRTLTVKCVLRSLSSPKATNFVDLLKIYHLFKNLNSKNIQPAIGLIFERQECVDSPNSKLAIRNEIPRQF